MNTYIAILSAASALLGTIIGGVISYFTTRYTITQQHRHDQRMREIEKRESLYSDFVAEATRLLLLCVEEKLSNVGEFTKIHSLHARIKIIGSIEVEAAAIDLVKQTMQKFAKQSENPKAEGETNSDTGKSRIRFTEAAKKELDELKKNA